jgi:beta-N-acetylhexosaminidase
MAVVTNMTKRRGFPVSLRSMVSALAVVATCAGCSFGLTTGNAAPPAASVASAPGSGAITFTSPATQAAGGGHPGSVPSAAASGGGSCPQRVYDSMTEAQRVGQLFLVGMPSNAATATVGQAIATYHFGSVLLNKTSASVTTLAADTTGIQALATQSGTAGARFFVAANQEGGQVQHLSGAGFSSMPSALAQGQLGVGTLRGDAQNWGSQLRQAGVNLDLAPVMDVVPAANVATNAPIGQLQREFGSDPMVTGPHGAAFIKGMTAAGVATSAKHFPGLGLVRGNTDFSANVTDTQTTTDAPSVASFQSAIGAHVPMVMIALATYTQIDPGHLAIFSPAVISTLLRGKLGFTGVVISDDIGQAQQVISIPAGDRAVNFIEAGGDLITSQNLPPAELMASAVLARANSNAGFRALVKAATVKVLAAKSAYGLLPC